MAVALLLLGIAIIMFFFTTDSRRGTHAPKQPSVGTEH